MYIFIYWLFWERRYLTTFLHSAWHSVKYSALQARAVQCSNVQYSAVKLSSVEISSVKCSRVPCTTQHHRIERIDQLPGWVFPCQVLKGKSRRMNKNRSRSRSRRRIKDGRRNMINQASSDHVKVSVTPFFLPKTIISLVFYILTIFLRTFPKRYHQYAFIKTRWGCLDKIVTNW